MRNLTKVLLAALPFSSLAWQDGRLVSWRILGYEWAEQQTLAYLQGPGVRYRYFGDIVVLDVLRFARYRRTGWVSALTLGRLCVYRRIGDLRSWRPSFKTIP